MTHSVAEPKPLLTSKGRPVRRALKATSLFAIFGLALAGCTPSDGEKSEAGGDTLRILVTKHALTKPMKDMAWAKDLEKAAGVKIKWEEVSADWDQKKPPMLASGDIPDLVVGSGAITDSDFATYGSLFEDLSKHLDALPNVQAMFKEVPQLKDAVTQQDGTIYSIPGYKRFWPETSTHQYINKQWLDTLGLSVPTTWDELYDVLVAFKKGDPNGNGKSDEIPWDWSTVGTGGFGYFSPSVLLGSVGLPTSGGGGSGYFLQDGKVGNFLVDERYQQVVEFLARCYEAGLISKEVMTHDYSAYQSVARGTGDTAAVGFSWGWTASDRFGTGVAKQYAAMAPLLAEAGQAEPVVWSYDQYGENFPSNQIELSAASGNKEAGLKVINAFYDQDISIQVLFGDIGPNITKTGDNAYKILPPADGKSDPSTWKWTSTLADLGPTWIRDDVEATLPTDLQEAVNDTKPLHEAFGNMDLKTDVYPAQFIKMSAEDLSTIALNNTTILNLTQTKFAEWVTKGGIDKQWDKYADQVNAAGLEANIKIYQQYYDTYMENQG